MRSIEDIESAARNAKSIEESFDCAVELIRLLDSVIRNIEIPRLTQICQAERENRLWIGGIDLASKPDMTAYIPAETVLRTLSKTETVKYLEIEAIKNDHSGEANGTVEPVKDSYKLNEPLTLEDAATAIAAICQNNGCPPETDCFDGQNCHECYKRFVAYRHKKEEGE